MLGNLRSAKRCEGERSSLLRGRDPAVCYLLLLASSATVTLICAAIWGMDVVSNLFFLRGEDSFMDFFNSMRDLLGGGAVYTERHVIYPPMANLIFLLFSLLVPEAYLSTPFAERYTWVSHPGAVAACICFLAVMAAALLAVTLRHYPRRYRVALALFSICNFPVFAGLERGNIALLSTAALFAYMLSYQSESRVSRECGLLALAFAISLKLYPLLFALPLLGDKRYKEAIRCGFYTLFLLLAPSFFFGGPRCLLWLAENILRFSSGRIDTVPGYLWFQTGGMRLFYYGLLAAGGVLLLILSFSHFKKWKLWTLAAALVLCFPPTRATYALAILLAPLALFFREEKLRGGRSITYFLLMTLPLLLLPIRVWGVNISELTMIYGAIALLLLSMGDGIAWLCRRKGARKTA